MEEPAQLVMVMIQGCWFSDGWAPGLLGDASATRDDETARLRMPVWTFPIRNDAWVVL